MNVSGSIYLKDEVIAMPSFYFDDISFISVFDTIMNDSDNDFKTDNYKCKKIKTVEQLYDSLLNLVKQYKKWKKNKRLTMIEEL